MSTLVEKPVVLVIAAHPGDAEGVCGGTLALLRQRGWRVALATMTAGDCGSNSLSAEATAELRREEARHALDLLEGDYYCLGSPDYAVVYADPSCRTVTALIRAVRPALVLTHRPDETTPDLEQTSRIVRQACLAAPARNYHTRDFARGSEHTGRTPYLYYLDLLGPPDGPGKSNEPLLIVDVTETFDTKANLLAQHGSQRVRAPGQPGLGPSLEELRAWDQERGQRVGCRFGEGFRQHLGPAYPRDNLLKQVLGPLAHEVA